MPNEHKAACDVCRKRRKARCFFAPIDDEDDDCCGPCPECGHTMQACITCGECYCHSCTTGGDTCQACEDEALNEGEDGD